MCNKKRSFLISDILHIIPGLIVSIIVSFISILLSKFIPNIGAATISIFLGMVVGNLFLNQKVFEKGYRFSETNLLSVSIVLLGGTLNISALIQVGWSGILLIILQMSITIIAALFIGEKLGFSENFRFMMASGNAVCGSSAIAATAPIIKADDKEKGIVITIVNVTGIFLMFLLPLISKFLYNQEVINTSAMIGGTLQSIGQVVASGAMVNENVKDLATIFKLIRVIFLVIVVLILAHLKYRKNDNDIDNSNKIKIKVPWYVIGFFITCTLCSVKLIPNGLSHVFKELSNKLEIIALAAIGLKVNIKDLIKQGKAASLYGLFIGLAQIISVIILIYLFL